MSCKADRSFFQPTDGSQHATWNFLQRKHYCASLSQEWQYHCIQQFFSSRYFLTLMEVIVLIQHTVKSLQINVYIHYCSSKNGMEWTEYVDVSEASAACSLWCSSRYDEQMSSRRRSLENYCTLMKLSPFPWRKSLEKLQGTEAAGVKRGSRAVFILQGVTQKAQKPVAFLLPWLMRMKTSRLGRRNYRVGLEITSRLMDEVLNAERPFVQE